ncbi:5305_t:CDS:1 [Paraglomus brasilianum]|uniref:5305_t:CDS:1 n=1 Tax=Paraglomus brasilianum TaxID=144538 RepID=A0A9N9AHK4_9GLOM|nr:5305_t:CDS:1 [Paraglomus brasilianum]
MASEDWQNQPILVKQYFNTLAKLALRRHKETYSDYVYRPRPKQHKKKNWPFIEVNKNRFTEQERADRQLNGSAQIDKQLQVLDDHVPSSDRVQQTDEYALLNGYVEQIKYGNFQLHAGDFVQLNGNKSDDYYYSQPNENNQLNGYNNNHAEVSALSVDGQRCEYTLSNEHYEPVSSIDKQQHVSLDEISVAINGFDITDNGYYVYPNDGINNIFTSSTVTNNMYSSGRSLCSNSDTLTARFGQHFSKESGANFLEEPFHTSEQSVSLLSIPNE